MSRLRRAGRLILSNLGLFLFSLVLALLLWLVVQNDQNPPRIDVVPSTLAVEPRNVPAGYAVFGTIEPISIRVAAPGDAWDRLRPSSFRVSIDLSNGEEGVGSFTPIIQVSDPKVRIVEVIPDRVDVRLEPIVRKVVPIRVTELDAVPLGFQSQPARSVPAEATVIGPAPLVNQVDSAIAEVRLDGIRINVNESVRLSPRNPQGQPVEGVRLDPDHSTVEITVEQRLHYRTVSIVPQVTGEPAGGYWLHGVAAEPSTVTIAGERATIQDLTFLSTVPLDLAGVSESQVRTVRLALPGGVSSVDGTSVRVRVTVAEITGSRSFSITPRLSNIAPGVTISVDPLSIEVVGPLSALQRADGLVVEVNAQGLGVGVHLVRPSIQLPEGLRLASPLPESVTLTVR